MVLPAVSNSKQAEVQLVLDDRLLVDVGLGCLSPELKAELLVFLNDQLELRVGAAIAAQLNQSELDDFGARFVDHEDNEGALCWLEDHVPSYHAVVRGELDRLRNDLRQSAFEIAGWWPRDPTEVVCK